MVSNSSNASWRLGSWQVNPALNQLQREVLAKSVEPRVMAALLVLMRAQGNVVTDAQLLENVWRGQIVSDASLYKVIAELRKSLGDSEKPYQYIERVSGKGYRLLITATELAEDVLPAASDKSMNGSGEKTDSITPSQVVASAFSTRRLKIWLAILLIAITAFMLWWRASGPWEDRHSPEPNHLTTHASLASANVDSMRNPIPQALQKPGDMSQEIWDHYLQARWLSSHRQVVALEQAISLFLQVLATAPNYANAEVDLCNTYHYMHLYSDWPLSKVLALCEPLLKHALQVDQSSASAYASFGMLKLSQGEAEAGASYLDKSLQLDPDNPIALMWRSGIYRFQGDIEQALPLIERAAQRDPLSGLIKRHYAFTLINAGHVSQARQVFREALLLEPEYSNRAMDELDMLPLTVERARSFLQWAQKFPDRVADINTPSPAINLALIRLSLNQMVEADTALKIAEKNFPQHQFTLLARAMWHDANRDPQQAKKYLQRRAALQPNNRQYQAFVLMYEAPKNPQEARQAIEHLFPDFAQAPAVAVRERLNNGQGNFVLFWLTSLTKNERQYYAPQINAWLKQKSEHDNLSLNLHLVLDQMEQANALAMSLLDQGWLPSPNDDFYIAERHPIWQKLNAEFFVRLAKVREQLSPLAP